MLSACAREAGWRLSTRSIRIRPGRGPPEWGRFSSLSWLCRRAALGDSVGGSGDRREMSSGSQTLNQGPI